MSKKKSSALARLMPSILVKKDDGTTIMVPLGEDENKIANQILASEMRSVIQTTMERYKSATLTPKELKELAEACRNVAEFSAEVYKGPAVITSEEKDVTPAGNSPAGSLDSLSFDKLNQPVEAEAEEEADED